MDRDTCARVIQRIRAMEAGTSLMEQAEFLRSQIARYQGDALAAGHRGEPDMVALALPIIGGIRAG